MGIFPHLVCDLRSMHVYTEYPELKISLDPYYLDEGREIYVLYSTITQLKLEPPE